MPTCKSEHDELLRIAAGTDVRLVNNYKDDSALARNWLSQFGNPYELVIVDADGALGVELGVYVHQRRFARSIWQGDLQACG